MEESILTSIKKLLGSEESYEYFDQDIIMCINSVFSILCQVGVGPSTGFFITNANATWDDFVGNDPRLNSVKTYTYLKTKMMFDPPTAGPMIEAVKSQIQELEWRLNVSADTGDTNI